MFVLIEKIVDEFIDCVCELFDLDCKPEPEVSEYHRKKAIEEEKAQRKINGPVAKIIANELRNGNWIDWGSDRWPLPNGNICLARRFHEDYRDQFPSLKYGCNPNPHYWHDEFVDEENGFFVCTAYYPEGYYDK